MGKLTVEGGERRRRGGRRGRRLGLRFVHLHVFRHRGGGGEEEEEEPTRRMWCGGGSVRRVRGVLFFLLKKVLLASGLGYLRCAAVLWSDGNAPPPPFRRGRVGRLLFAVVGLGN